MFVEEDEMWVAALPATLIKNLQEMGTHEMYMKWQGYKSGSTICGNCCKAIVQQKCPQIIYAQCASLSFNQVRYYGYKAQFYHKEEFEDNEGSDNVFWKSTKREFFSNISYKS